MHRFTANHAVNTSQIITVTDVIIIAVQLIQVTDDDILVWICILLYCIVS